MFFVSKYKHGTNGKNKVCKREIEKIEAVRERREIGWETLGEMYINREDYDFKY